MVILLALRFLLMIKDLDQDMVLMTRSSLATLRSAWTSDPGSDLGEGWWLTFSDLSFSSRPLSIESVLNVLPSEHSVIFFSLWVKNCVHQDLESVGLESVEIWKSRKIFKLKHAKNMRFLASATNKKN